jgi:AcrR family transcriptional regulator
MATSLCEPKRGSASRGVRGRPLAPKGLADGPLRTGADRSQDILLAAEQLFAQHGYHAVTIRQIALAAQVPLALVGYYYGQKHELFEALFARWATTIEARTQQLQAALSAPADQRLERIVTAFVQPVLRLRASPEGGWYALLVARELLHAREDTDRVLRQHFDPMAHAFIDALQGLYPERSRAEVAWAYQFMLGSLLHHLSDNRVHRLSRGSAAAVPTGQSEALLCTFLLGGLAAALGRPHAVPLPITTSTAQGDLP